MFHRRKHIPIRFNGFSSEFWQQERNIAFLVFHLPGAHTRTYTYLTLTRLTTRTDTMKTFLPFQLFFAILATTVLAAPAVQNQVPILQHHAVDTITLSPAGKGNPFVTKGSSRKGSAKAPIVKPKQPFKKPASPQGKPRAGKSRMGNSWGSAKSSNLKMKREELSCFCAGGSTCCQTGGEEPDCRFGVCGL